MNFITSDLKSCLVGSQYSDSFGVITLMMMMMMIVILVTEA